MTRKRSKIEPKTALSTSETTQPAIVFQGKMADGSRDAAALRHATSLNRALFGGPSPIRLPYQLTGSSTRCCQFGPGLLIYLELIHSWPLYLRVIPLSAARGPALVGDGRPAKA